MREMHSAPERRADGSCQRSVRLHKLSGRVGLYLLIKARGEPSASEVQARTGILYRRHQQSKSAATIEEIAFEETSVVNRHEIMRTGEEFCPRGFPVNRGAQLTAGFAFDTDTEKE